MFFVSSVARDVARLGAFSASACTGASAWCKTYVFLRVPSTRRRASRFPLFFHYSRALVSHSASFCFSSSSSTRWWTSSDVVGRWKNWRKKERRKKRILARQRQRPLFHIVAASSRYHLSSFVAGFHFRLAGPFLTCYLSFLLFDSVGLPTSLSPPGPNHSSVNIFPTSDPSP